MIKKKTQANYSAVYEGATGLIFFSNVYFNNEKTRVNVKKNKVRCDIESQLCPKKDN